MNIKKLSQIILAIILLAAGSQISFAQNKDKLVSQLVDLTIIHFPSAQLRKPLQETQEKMTDSLNAELTKTFTDSIEADEKLNDQQKANMKEHLPELIDELSRRYSAKLQIAFSNNLMVKESLWESYQKLSVAELKKTISFVKKPVGKSFLKYLEELTVSIFEKAETEPQQPTKYEAQIEKFGKTSAGDKFLDAFISDAVKIFFEKTNLLIDNYTKTLDKDKFQTVIVEFRNKYSN